MNKTFIDIFGLHVGEPTTTLTNIMISALSIFLFFRLSHPTKEFKINSYWRMFFLFFGTSAFMGIFKHGFKSYFSEDAFNIVQMLGLLASVPIAYYNFKINIEYSNLKVENKKICHIIALSFSIVIAVLAVIFNQFVVVKIMAATAIVVTIINHALLYKKGNEAAGKIVKGFSISIASVIVHTTKFSFCEWFNYVDIAHVFMMISLIYLYQGVKIISAQESKTKSEA